MHRRPQTPLALVLALVPALVKVAARTAAATALLAPAIAAAQAPPADGPVVPGAESFDIRYYLTDKDGNRGRPMAATDFQQFVNKARCECGHEIETQVRLKSTQGKAYDNTVPISTMIGTNCSAGEVTPFGQYRPCAVLQSSNAGTYVQPGVNVFFHPIWLKVGVSIESSQAQIRNPQDASAAGTCDTGFGTGGVWICADTNGANCQAEEFFINGTQNNNLPAGMSSGIAFDFIPPLAEVENVKAIAGDSAIVISWDVQPGDINGFRVLCEEADTGKPPPNKGMKAPPLDQIPNGTIFYTKDNLCPGGPFSTFKAGSNAAVDPGVLTAGTSDTDDTGVGTDGTGDTDGTGGSDDTGGSGSTGGTSLTCGDGVLDEGEECDDGAENGDDKACHSDCLSDVCGDALQGPAEECDNGEDNSDTGLCRPDCTLNGSEGLISLDWSYVCTGHLAYNTGRARIEGLENDKKYNFLLVAYDKSGNPRPHTQVLTATPVNTRDLWEQCEAQGNVCGESGFCNVAGRGDNLLALGGLLGLGLGLGGLMRRNRRKRA